jgi:hypothetical protein
MLAAPLGIVLQLEQLLLQLFSVVWLPFRHPQLFAVVFLLHSQLALLLFFVQQQTLLKVVL